MKSVSIFFCTINLLLVTALKGQNYFLQESHSEAKYNYVLMDSSLLGQLTEIEKIKYELTFEEKSIKTIVKDNFYTNKEITYDSISNHKDWLKRPKKILFTEFDYKLFDTDGQVIKTVNFDEQQASAATVEATEIKDLGFHPGLAFFPIWNDNIANVLNNSNVPYQNLGLGAFSVTPTPGYKNTYNRNNLEITTEWLDESGQPWVETTGYFELDNAGGFLPLFSKKETTITTTNGLCITAVELVYFFDYIIIDPGQLMKKNLSLVSEYITVSPNPNNGHFKLSIQLAPSSQLLEVKLVNLVTGISTIIPNGNGSEIMVDLPDLPAGNYAILVTTNNKIISKQFIKQ